MYSVSSSPTKHFFSNIFFDPAYLPFQNVLFAPQEQLLLELDMYQDIAVARGSTYDTLNKRMDRYNRGVNI
jgi:hypothetical protein